MNGTRIFATEPFPVARENLVEQLEFEDEWRRNRFARPPRPGPINRPVKPRQATPKALPARGKQPRPLPRPGYRSVIDARTWPLGPDRPPTGEHEGSEYVRWIQDCLNNLLGTRLPINGVISPATRSALRRFQRQHGLRASGILDPDSAAALRRACRAAPLSGNDPQAEFELPVPAGRGGLAGELSFPQALASAGANGPGIYTLHKQGKPFYVGCAIDLRRRLQEHFLCLTRMGISPKGYSVEIRPMSVAQLKAEERAAIQKWGLRSQGGLLTNQKARELEQDLDGEDNAMHTRNCGCHRCRIQATSFEIAPFGANRQTTPPRRQQSGSWRRHGPLVVLHGA